MPRGENQFGRILFDMFQDIDVEDGIEFLLVVEIREHTHEDFAVLQVRERANPFREPDSAFAKRISSLPHLQNCEVLVGMLPDPDDQEKFDAILYIDVLEHIKEDAAELILAARHLKTNGVIVVLAPAFPWLYTQFDAAIGHFRRYTRNSLRKWPMAASN